MKLSIESGTVVCSLEDKNKDFLYACYPIFNNGYKNGKLFLREGLIESMYWQLKKAVANAEAYGVEITEAVRERFKDLKDQYEAENMKRLAEEARERKERHWLDLKENGCGNCKLCQRLWDGEDDYVCLAGEKPITLDIANRPKYDYIHRVYLLFNYVPLPTESCPYNTDKGRVKECENSDC